ncbi:16S rRNA (cytidine1402-2'-O)-methyltransferase [Loktanella sp. DSM 29012]|uniref:Ribosomal RNA small subunit methyltransferase I n=1 Tax=Loktanella gaetbuli TaxID=2881335 RepID=A0ABS8BX60_9RHOB|nr:MULTISPECIES: 16S rRNA (cytidine(1402)-2'-O)-methyltransferase [Loktanella]MCB5200336.1 16S rRNA (cytidine(1402)-2'-O)-methyltransferase [Loktanella gaetbuli]SEP74061.1 16S rRNA (cytidine1402-2'-O)-methyltransferase [Loktanella sp. DSM 29012]
MNHLNVSLSAGLYLVATPIGTARDITLRALDILASCDMIAAEDTRTARKLMEIHGIPLGDRRIIAFHDHSSDAAVARLVNAIRDGASLACVSEAGTPLIADPGFELARAVRAAGLPVTAAPGPSAVVTALSVGDLPTDRFAFCGFLPAAPAARLAELVDLRDLPFTLVFYESPKRIHDFLAAARDALGSDRQASVCRELTKKFEEVSTGRLSDLVDAFDGRNVKGEIVVLIGRAGAVAVVEADIEVALRQAMQTMRVKDAATAVAGAMGLPRRQVYQTALQLGKDEDDAGNQ